MSQEAENFICSVQGVFFLLLVQDVHVCVEFNVTAGTKEMKNEISWPDEDCILKKRVSETSTALNMHFQAQCIFSYKEYEYMDRQ